jgi:hypothetical protein
VRSTCATASTPAIWYATFMPAERTGDELPEQGM